jgi:hypothetical protein
MMACDIGSFAGVSVALSHLVLNLIIALCCLVVFALIAREAGLLLRLTFVCIPIGALVNVGEVLSRGCRDVSAGEFAMLAGVALLGIWLVVFHRARLLGYRRDHPITG